MQELEWPPESAFVGSRIDIKWWESRRLSFNAFVGVTGLASWLLVLFAGSAAVKPGVDFEEPLAMLFGPVVYCIIANVGYTLGWIVDTIFYRGAPRKRLYKTGLVFSLILTALPGVWAVVAWLITVCTGEKMD